MEPSSSLYPDDNDQAENLSFHDEWRIALYYYYVDIPNAADHVVFHEQICNDCELTGRIRISAEGINGVLSGKLGALQQYEAAISKEIERITQSSDIDLDVKYCRLREDLSIEAQLFPSLQVKQTKTVISLFDDGEEGPSTKNQKKKRRSEKSKRRKETQPRTSETVQLVNNEPTSGDPHPTSTLNSAQSSMLQQNFAAHLSASEWNEQLLLQQQHPNSDNHSPQHPKPTTQPLLLDVRNVYESRVGHFCAPHVPTLLTNTRKYSDLPPILAQHESVQTSNPIFMYCTGGVRCERVSQLVQTLYPDKQVYQLQGGIQTYLQNTVGGGDNMEEETTTAKERNASTSSSSCLFRGKNFVFDPRRTDPIYQKQTETTIVGHCLVCQGPHDDYDNGHAPSEHKEARCNQCRMLVLVCNECRLKFQCFGEKNDSNETNHDKDLPLLYCGHDKCIHEGVAPTPELITLELDI